MDYKLFIYFLTLFTIGIILASMLFIASVQLKYHYCASLAKETNLSYLYNYKDGCQMRISKP